MQQHPSEIIATWLGITIIVLFFSAPYWCSAQQLSFKDNSCTDFANVDSIKVEYWLGYMGKRLNFVYKNKILQGLVDSSVETTVLNDTITQRFVTGVNSLIAKNEGVVIKNIRRLCH